jgi:hypothetical protein
MPFRGPGIEGQVDGGVVMAGGPNDVVMPDEPPQEFDAEQLVQR